MESETTNILLVGNPNCGKTSIFNILAGLNQKVTNIPGTTVEKVSGKIKINNKEYTLIDLPGAYSLFPKSEDELVAAKEILSTKNAIIVFVADATRLESNLFYFSQIADLGLPTMLALNMVDLAKSKGIQIDTDALSQKLGVLVVSISALKSEGIETLKNTFHKVVFPNQNPFYNSYNKSEIGYKDFVSQQIKSGNEENKVDETRKKDASERQKMVADIISNVVTRLPYQKRLVEKLDQLLIHPVWGIIIMLAIMTLIFQSVFMLAEVPMQGIEWIFIKVGGFVNESLPAGFFNDLVVEGLISGLAGVVVFVPQIVILFFFIGLLEETGYITRISFLSDRFMRRFGLSGKSVIPMTGGLACAIPSIMAARTIENKAERLATIFIIPLMTCSARLPVYTLLISMLVPEDSSVWIFNTRGLVLMGMYLLGFVSALLFALIFRLFIKAKANHFFVLEMPELRPPRWKPLFYMLYKKSMMFLSGAGKVILIVSLILFFLKSFGPSDDMQQIKSRYQAQYGNELSPEIERQQNSELLEASWIGRIGKVIEPAIRPLGYDWKIGIALTTSFAAREVFVGTMSAIYGLADDEEGTGLRDMLQKQTDPVTGLPVYTFPVLISLLLFYAIALQCASTVAVVYKETKSLKYTAIQLVSMYGAAYVVCMFAYNFLS
ncbi:MAG: ferrous iron transport protein B [Bacteroidetes bacterium]|nr:ferrous iron transport protein B [Bacteroidota bacterium]